MDEVGFGPSREPRRLPPRLRAFGAALVLAGAAAAAVAFAVTAAHGQRPVPPSPAGQAAPAPAVHLTLTVCAPVDTTWPNLAALPAGLRTRARSVIIDEQFSGQCPPR